MTRKNWEQGGPPALGVFLNGEELRDLTPRGEPVVDESFLLLFNAHHEPIEFTLPPRRFGRHWQVVLSTFDPDAPADRHDARTAVTVESRSLLLLQRV
jgi:glycogen operon protein